MPIYLRQSTASQEIPLGYFVDSTDGNTEETALTINASDIKVWKTGATTLANKNSGGATHISNGLYYAVLDATDTDTIGPLVVFVHVSGALAVRVECCVLDEAVYDVQFGTTAPATATNITAGTITTATNVTTVNGLAANVITAASMAADASAEIADAVWDEDATAHQTGGTFGQAIGDPGADTNTIFGAVVTNATGNTVGDDTASLLSRMGTPSNLGGGATLSANLSDIESQTDDIGAAGAGLTAIQLPSNGLANVTAWTVAITGNVTGNLSGSVGSVTGAVGSVTGNVGGNVTGSVGSVATGGISAASIADGAIDRATFAADTGLQTVRSNTAQAGGATSITLDASASSVNDFYTNCLVRLTGGTGAGQARFITAYDGTTKVATVVTWQTNPDNTSTFAILPFDTAPANTRVWSAGETVNANTTQIFSQSDAASALSNILMGTAGETLVCNITGNITGNLSGTVGTVNALAANAITAAATAADFGTEVGTAVWATATRTLTSLDEDSTTLDLDATIRAAVGLASANLDTQLTAIDDYLDTEVAAIKAKTDNLPAAPAATGDCITAAGVRTAVGLASANLDTQLDALPTAAENAAAVHTTVMTESYNTDGSAPTLAQAIYVILQMLTEKSISSTTLTVKKLDGTTTAATFTLNSATTPTSITRAT